MNKGNMAPRIGDLALEHGRMGGPSMICAGKEKGMSG